MTFPCKEALITLEQLGARQTWYAKPGEVCLLLDDATAREARAALTELREFYGGRTYSNGDASRGGTGPANKGWRLFVPYEQDGNFWTGYAVHVVWNRGADGTQWLTLLGGAAKLTQAEAWARYACAPIGAPPPPTILGAG